MTQKGQTIGAAIWVTLVAMVCVGCVLRFARLDFQSLWYDETGSWYLANYPDAASVVAATGREDVHPPGYEVMLWGWCRLFGQSATAMRSLSAVFGVLCIPLIFFLGRRVYSAREGLIAAGLMCVSWAPVFYSQEARSFAPMLALGLAASYFWWGIVTAVSDGTRPSRTDMLAYIAMAAALSYMHYFGLLLVALQGAGLTLYALIARRRSWWVILVYVPVIIIYMPWLARMGGHATTDRSFARIPLIWTMIDWAKFSFGESNIVLAAVLALGAVAVWKCVAHNGHWKAAALVSALVSRQNVFLWLWLTVPYILAETGSLLGLPVFTYRNLIASIPAAYILVARSIVLVSSRPRIQTGLAVGLAMLALGHLTLVMQYYTRVSKQQVREACMCLMENSSKYPDAMIVTSAVWKCPGDYYFTMAGFPHRVDHAGCSPAALTSLREMIGQRHPKYILFLRVLGQDNAPVIAYMRETYPCVFKRDFYLANAWVFQCEQTAGGQTSLPGGTK